MAKKAWKPTRETCLRYLKRIEQGDLECYRKLQTVMSDLGLTLNDLDTTEEKLRAILCNGVEICCRHILKNTAELRTGGLPGRTQISRLLEEYNLQLEETGLQSSDIADAERAGTVARYKKIIDRLDRGEISTDDKRLVESIKTSGIKFDELGTTEEALAAKIHQVAVTIGQRYIQEGNLNGLDCGVLLVISFQDLGYDSAGWRAYRREVKLKFWRNLFEKARQEAAGDMEKFYHPIWFWMKTFMDDIAGFNFTKDELGLMDEEWAFLRGDTAKKTR